jgi:hypothetical protein
MFERVLQHSRAGGTLATAMVVLGVGTACKDPFICTCAIDVYTAMAGGANVVPVTTNTAPSAVMHFEPLSLAYSYSVAVAPSAPIDSIALYQVAAGDTLPASATAILCAGVAACAATSGTAMLVAPATGATITTSMRAYSTQVVFFTTTAQKAAGGAMRGVVYLSPL